MSRKSENEKVSKEAFCDAIHRADRDTVRRLLKADALDLYQSDARNTVIQSLVGLRDMSVMNELAKTLVQFTPDMFALELNLRNRQFIREVFERHYKKFDLNDSATCDWLMNMSALLNSKKVARLLIRQHKGLDSLPSLAASGNEVFHVLVSVNCDTLSPDLTVAILCAAARYNDSFKRLNMLLRAGYDLRTVNSNGDNSLALLRHQIADTTYPRNKTGDISRKLDRLTLQTIERLTAEESHIEKSVNRKLIYSLIAVIILLIAIIAYTYSYERSYKDTENLLGTESVTDTETVTNTEQLPSTEN